MKILLLILITVFTTFGLHGQAADTLSVPADSSLFPSDSLMAADSAAGKKYDVDTTIFASASDSIIFFINKKEMNLYGNGELDYKDTHLESANISVDFKTSDVNAVGAPSDSIPGKEMGTPVLSDKGEEYKGKSMKYNFKTGRGLISSAGTETEGAYYTGSKINKVDKDTYFIEDGIFTTCEDSVPHYYFYSPEMKVIHKQQIVAKWIWMFFGGVPFPIPLPFAVFPIESGRRSGILTPAFGLNGTYGYYFSRFGYFWAISDYTDWNITADYFTRGSYNLNSRFRYSKRYSYSGNIEGSYSNFKGGETDDPDFSREIEWRLKLYHNQTIDPTLKLTANMEFTSGSKYYNRNVADVSQSMRNLIVSTANLSKTWESGSSLSLGYSRTQDMESGNISEVLPSLQFSLSQKYPFRSSTTSTTNLTWYEMIGVSYNSQLRNTRNKSDGVLKIRGGIQHDLSVNASPKVGYVSITPSLSYREKWYNKKTVKESGVSEYDGEDTVFTKDVHQINMLRTFSLGVSAQTRFFGIFNPNMLGVNSIRHTVTPSISYSYTPDFSKPFWGYYETYTDTNGNITKYDPFASEIYSGVSSYESQAISFSLDNLFEMKTTVDPTDTTSKENKIRLLNLKANISYDFNDPDQKFSPLALNGSTQIGEWFSFNSSANFSLYGYDSAGTAINQYLWDQKKELLRLTYFTFSVSTSLSGEKLASGDKKVGEGDDENEFSLSKSQQKSHLGLYEEKEADFTIPWSLSLNYNFSQSQSNPFKKTVYSSISGSFDFNLTPAWKFSFTGSYDIKNREFSAPQILISRDLHCWVMNFTWNPIGTYRGYRLEIRVKAPQLQDLKITKRDEFYSGK
jgi:lipopolysaccharide assembly outer membrane protein LptD (OstA)